MKEIDYLADLMYDIFNYRPSTHIVDGFRVKEEEDGYTFEIVLPGVSKDDMELSLKSDGELILSLKLKVDSIFYKAGEKIFTLAKDIDPDTLTSSIKDGILTIKAKKVKENKKEIKIDIG